MSSDISNPDRKLDFVWLDTTNTIISIARRLPRIDKIMADNSVIAITAVKGREQERIYMSRDEYISGLLEPMGFKLKERIDYMDTSPMCHFIYVRENK